MPTFRTVSWSGDVRNAGIVVPEEVLASFDAGKRMPVVVTVDGGYRYRSTTAVMGGQNLISFNAQTRAATGWEIGDEVEVTLGHDTAPRTVEVPAALRSAFEDDDATAVRWTSTAPSRQKAYASSVTDAKTEATRERRVAMFLQELRS